MAVLTAIAIGAAVVAAGATAYSAIKQGEATAASKQQYKYQRQLANNQAARERVNAIREARLAQGALAQTAETSGAAGSSIALGAQGSIQSQLNSRLSFLDTNQSLANLAGYYGSKANIKSQQAQTGASISATAQSIFSMSGGFNRLGLTNG